MASKFMAFESVASTSSVSMENSEDTNGERIEMNSGQYPNYQSNQSHTMTNDSNPYGAVDEDDNMNENLDEKQDDSVGYRKFIYNNSEQFKSICGGLLLLLGSGIHIVWGIFRVFNLYNCEETNSFYLRTVIWSWYIGAIIGNCFAGYALLKFRKGHLYFIGGALLAISGIFLMFAEYDISLLTSRLVGGFTHGLIYVVVVVHASDNATKEFREFLMLIVGAVLNYSILLSVLAFFHTEGLFRTDLLNGLGLIAFGICSALITTKHSTETVPFILQNDGSELDALQTVSKLRKKSISARIVHHDFLAIKNLVQDEMEQYGTPEFRKVLLPENRNSFIFCCYGRLCSVLSFNLPLIVMIMLFLRNWTDGTFKEHNITATDYCPKNSSYLGEHNKGVTMKNDNGEIVINTPLDRILRKRHAELARTEINIDKPKSLDHESDDKEIDDKSKNSKVSTTEQKNFDKTENESKSKGSEGQKAEEKMSDKNEKEKEKESNSENKPNNIEQTLDGKEEDIQQKDHVNKESHHVPSSKEKDLKHSSDKEVESKTKLSEKKLSKEKEHEKTDQKHTEKKGEETNEKKTNEKTASNEKELHNKESNGKPSKDSNKHEIHVKKEVSSSPTFFAHLIIFLHSRELTLVLLAWFIFGTVTAVVLYTFHLKRFIYYIACVLSSVLAVAGLAHSFNLLSGILHFCLIVYFNYVTIPIDVFGHCMLAEAFPVTLKPFSVASVAIIEHLVHIIVITLYLSEWFHNSILLLMCIVAFISHEIARNLPQKGNLPLAEARAQYQNINLMLFNEPKTGYNQQQEFI